MSGWYRMHRGWMDHALFKREAYSRRDAFQWLIQEAAFQSTTVAANGGTVQLERGQLSYSIRFMAKAWKWDEKKVRRFLEDAAAAEIIERGDAAGQTLITICKYDYYQTDQRGDAALLGEAAPQLRRGGAAKNKELEEGKKEEVARERARGGAKNYAFEGRTIRLTVEDLNRWAVAYPHVDDLRHQLERIDEWWEGQPPADRRNWFNRTSGMLRKRNGEREAANAAAKRATEVDMDIFERRHAEFEARYPDAVARYREMDRIAAEARARDEAYAASARESQREIN